jgi:hypothetical protein
MKLNLLPQTVSKGRALTSASIVAAAMVVASLVLTAMMITASQGNLKAAVDHVNGNVQDAVDAVATSTQADNTIAKAADPIRNANLAQALEAHNDVYPALYEDLMPYIPNFFRITAMIASPEDASTSRVTMTGTLRTYQQYSDLMLALMRFKDAVSISRTGFNLDDPLVPPISEENPVATPHKPSEPVVPTDQLAKIAYYQAQGRDPGYTGAGNFGDGQPDMKGAMPGESLITVVLTVRRNLQVPDAQSTLQAAGPATAAGAGALTTGMGGPGGPTMGGAGGMGGPGGPTMGGPGGPGGPPSPMSGPMGPGGPTTRSRSSD